MTATNPFRSLNFYRGFLALMATAMLAMDIAYTTYLNYAMSQIGTDNFQRQNFLESRASIYVLLFTPDVFALLMMAILILNRPRLSSKTIHIFCRIFFSLGLAALLLYYPVSEIIGLKKALGFFERKRIEAGFDSDSGIVFNELYMCGSQPDKSSYELGGPSGDDDWMEVRRGYDICLTARARSFLAIILAVGVVGELVFSAKSGDLKERRVAVDEEKR